MRSLEEIVVMNERQVARELERNGNRQFIISTKSGNVRELEVGESVVWAKSIDGAAAILAAKLSEAPK